VRSRWTRLIRPQDVVWLPVFAILIATLPVADAPEVMPVVALGVAQVLEPKLFRSTRGRIFWIALKLAFGFMLMGYTGGINSPYFLVMFLPVVSAANFFGVLGTLISTLLASGAYLTYLLFVREWADVSADVAVRIAALLMVGNLASILVEEIRRQSEQHRLTAEQLAQANVQIREAEEAVRRSDRLAALGQLSAGLAHELRNPLGTIRASSEMLGKSLRAENEVAREVAGFITSEVDRCNSLVTRFLEFARPLKLRTDRADLAQVLDRAVAAVGREVPAVVIYKNYQPDIAPFPFDAELMERVFYNLIVNAARATAPGGTVTVKTRAAGGFVEISVIDRGCGIEAKQLDSIFNPFFTTKPSGVGLGLAIVAKIVDEHGGEIAVESEVGKGSIFRVRLPAELKSGQASQPA